ncbi:9158_t:CDS:1 [Acaulospora colombiana]|uniref:9158_t:CDS:1 n=1 Tax=Acaulospora colombiana TaxID=27376 RepID=A0ACA9LZ35_9GLOM|nr:9158_t:CDS:1 [Acaulospora colombiana]
MKKPGNGYLIFRAIKLLERQDCKNPIKMADHSDVTSKEWNDLPHEEQLIYFQIHEIMSEKYRVNFDDPHFLVFEYDPNFKENEKYKMILNGKHYHLCAQYKKWYDFLKEISKSNNSTLNTTNLFSGIITQELSSREFYDPIHYPYVNFEGMDGIYLPHDGTTETHFSYEVTLEDIVGDC